MSSLLHRLHYTGELVLFSLSYAHIMDVAHPYMRDRIVDLHAWCLMRNHYHLLISERVEGGLTSFLRKLSTGYTNYFNERYKRSGVLFQGRTKKAHINSEAYFLHILNYVHFNPCDYVSEGKGWRTRQLRYPERAHQYLMKYRWSSYPDYCGQSNFPSVLTTELFGERPDKFKKRIFEYSGLDPENLPPQLLLD